MNTRPTLAEAAQLFKYKDGQLFRDGEPVNQICRRTHYTYKRVSVGKWRFVSSRLIWCICKGAQPIGEIDHIDGDPLNNHISNLRDASHGQNQQNMRRKKPKASGLPQGVRPVSGCKGRYQAILMHRGVNVHIGNYGSVEEASIAYRQKKRALCGEYSPF